MQFAMNPETLLHQQDDDLLPEYDLKTLLKNGVRGKYAERFRAGTNLVLLAPDVADAFPTENAVNDALRLVIQLKKLSINIQPQAAL